MDILKARVELQTMSGRDLLRLALGQRISKCLIGGGPCSFHLQYKETSFCVSEIMREGCQTERVEQLEQPYLKKKKVNCSLPLKQKMETELTLSGERPVRFNVYYRSQLTRSTIFLGDIVERRRKERGDNLKSLLSKAMKEYSNYVEDPSAIFLLAQ